MKLTQIGPNLYTTPDKRLYAFLEEPWLQRGTGTACWYRCSKDGEPSHEVRLKGPIEILSQGTVPAL